MKIKEVSRQRFILQQKKDKKQKENLKVLMTQNETTI